MQWSRNAIKAKARKRMADPVPSEEPKFRAPILPRLKFATVSIRIGSEAATFRVHRWNEKQLFALGKPQVASTIGKRVALVLQNLL